MRWLALARDESAEVPEDVQLFADMYEVARAVKVRELEETFANVHATHDWRACLALLKALDRERWGDGLSQSDADEMMRLRIDRERDARELAAMRVRLAALEVADRTPAADDGGR